MNIRSKILFFYTLFVISFSSAVIAQGEANIWYFGNNAGLDFNTNPPTPLTNGALNTSEGCASISNKNGALVFYTDGTTVWNTNHVAMPNGTGLFGNSSATQSVIICPYPGTYNYSAKRFNKYYIITIDYNGGSKGVRYSEVDMTLNGGLGGVTAVKNVFLYGTTTTEKICVAQSANDCDYWVIGKPVGTLNYHAYAITSAGFNVTPVISAVGPTMNNHLGSLKASPDSKIVTATHGSTTVGLFVYDFNNATGVLTSKFSDVSVSGYPYSQEFSPDNKILYYSLLNNPNIYQYDLTVPDNTSFLASRQIIGTTANTIGYRMCALQVASDGKIYAALHGKTSLGVINSPNTLGTGCGYVDMQQGLAGRTSTLGLPAIVTSLIRPVNAIVLNDSCAKQVIQFGLLDTFKIVSYNWQFASATAPNVLIGTSALYNPVMQFDTAGNYIVTAINQYACYTDTIIDTVTIFPLPIISLTTANISCFGLTDGSITASASGATAPYSYVWSNAAATAAITGLPVANYLVTITDVKGCASRDSTVITSPVSAVSIDNTFINHVTCFGDTTGDATIIAIGGTPPYSYSWNTSPVQNTQQATALQQGTYTCTVTDTNLCTVTQNVTINEPAKLIADITNSLSLCKGDSGTLSSLSTGGNGSYGYIWQPGGVTTQNVIIAPDSTTNYVLTVTDQNNCVAKDSSMVIINPNPVVNFGSSPVCAGVMSLFTDSSSIAAGQITSYSWTYGVGTAGSTVQNPVYLYPGCAIYSVVLTAVSDSGCTASDTKPVTVYCQPTAAFTVNSVCISQPAAFTNVSAGAVFYAWDFEYNTGIDDTTASPIHTYSAGSYDVQLIAGTLNGCTDTVVHSIDVYPLPTADFTTANVCLNNLSSFTDLSVVPGPDNITNWQWDFDYNTGLDDSVQSPGKLYAQPGTYTVLLKVITNNGCIDTITKSVIIFPLPDAKFSAANVCDGNSVLFTDASVITAPGAIQAWSWDFGNTTQPAVNQNTSHLFSSSGAYSVGLFVVSDSGCTDSVTQVITVNPNPLVSFAALDTTGCEPLCVSFINSSSVTTGANAQWSWNAGDGSGVSNSQAFEHCYINDAVYAPGFFDVSLTVTSDSGCVSSLSKNAYITVYPAPDAAFTAQPTAATITDPVISITDLSTGTDYWSWNFGDGPDTSSAGSSSYTYADTGIYTITLIVSTLYNCKDTATETVVIEPDFLFYIPNAFTPDGDGINDSFSGKGTFISSYEMTIFDRWGNLIFFSDNINKPWDGKANRGNETALLDVYIYSFKITDFKGTKHNYKGIVTLVR